MNDKSIGPILIFIIFILGLSLANGFKKDLSFSEFENRPLAQFPKFTVERLLNGTFTEQFETYMTDQFIGKTFWTGLKAKAEQSVLKQENNDVYFGKEDYLFEKPKPITKQLSTNIDAINQFKEKFPSLPLTLLLAPTSIDLYPERLPPLAQRGMHGKIADEVEKQLSKDVHFINPLQDLEQVKTESIYFRTDHHWTTTGAFYTYQRLMKEKQVEFYQQADFQLKEVSHQFYGTYYAKANNLSIAPDKIVIYELIPPFQHRVQADNRIELDSLYDASFLEKRDQYAYFLGGNHAQTVITTNINNGQRLLLLKDSYAHAIAPFLANHFEEIHLIDLRYYRGNLQQYIKAHDITEGLILYNSPNFAADTTIIQLKYN